MTQPAAVKALTFDEIITRTVEYWGAERKRAAEMEAPALVGAAV
mgnify:CR=1 FL=1